jgi:hypothetical protein
MATSTIGVPTLRVKLSTATTPLPRLRPAEKFWFSAIPRVEPSESDAKRPWDQDEKDVQALEHRFVEEYPQRLTELLYEQYPEQMARLNDGASSSASAKRPAFAVRIVRYDSLVFDLAFVGKAAQALLTDPTFIAALTSTFLPHAFHRTFQTGVPLWATIEETAGMPQDRKLDGYWALANYSLVLTAALLALAAYLMLSAAFDERAQVVDAYDKLTKTQQALIESLNKAAAAPVPAAGARGAAATPTTNASTP